MAEKTKFGTVDAISSTTPTWANWVFRIILIVTTALSAWLMATALVPEAIKFEVVLILKGVDFVSWGVSRLFGVVIDKK